MVCRFENAARTFLIFAVAFIALGTVPAYSLGLDHEYTIPLDEDDRVLGSMKGNYLIYGRPQITMYNSRGKAVFSRKLKNNVKPTLSPSGKHLGLVTYADHSPTDLRTLKLEIFDQSGTKLWEMKDPAPNSFMIADNGAIFGIEGVEGIPPTRLHLFDQYGGLLNILTFDTYHGILISPQGGKFIIDRARGGLEVYDSLGNFLDSLPVSKNYVFDRDERYIATFFQGIFRLFQDEKEVVTINSSELVIREMAINVDQNLVVLMAAKRLEVYELTTQKLLWEHQLVAGSKWFSSLDLSGDGRFITCGLDINGGNQVPRGQRHIEGYLMVYSTASKNLIKHKEDYKTWAVGLPRSVFPNSSGSVIMQTREKVSKFKIK